MIDYFVRYHDKLLAALGEHVVLVATGLALSLVLAASLTLLCIYSKRASEAVVGVCSMIYSIPSLAMFALLIPLTGLGKGTAILVLILYNQYLLLRNFVTGLNEVEPAVVDAATGMGMTNMQVLFKIRLPLARRALLTGVRLAVVSTIGIATVAASINAGGLGTILFDGLRTYNVDKIVWGSLLLAGLAIVVNAVLGFAEKRIANK